MRKIASLVVVMATLLSISGVSRAQDEFFPRQKECVDNPPRQTEDPLSPPCVPYFEGDNGGDTYSGVTRDEVAVVLYNDLGISGDLDTPWQPSDETLTTPDGGGLVRTLKAQVRYFKERYQTYGRVIHVIARPSSGGASETCSARQGDAAVLAVSMPFAVVAFGDNMDCFVDYAAEEYHISSFLLGGDISSTRLSTLGPFLWSFLPEQETEAAYSASFICRSLASRVARFSTDPLLAGHRRTFGLIRPKASLPIVSDLSRPRNALYPLSEILIRDVKNRCGLTFRSVDDFDGNGLEQASTIIAKYKGMGITTVVCYCDPTASTVTAMQSSASSLQYRPEWYWDHASRMDRAMNQRQYGDPLQTSFGVSYFWRMTSFNYQYATEAYLTQEPGTSPNARYNWDIYHSFLQFFAAVQTAGPNLTPQTVERGMFTLRFTDLGDPYEPVGAYGPDGIASSGDYSFIDTGMAWWWDRLGTEPGGQHHSGCVRVARQGTRSYAGTWPRGDSGLFTASDPCTAAAEYSATVPL